MNLKIDEEGYFVENGRLTESEGRDQGRKRLESLFMRAHSVYCHIESEQDQSLDYFVECFDAPLVVKKVGVKSAGQMTLTFPYGYEEESSLNTLRFDLNDRFCGHNNKGVPYVFSRNAQEELFQLADSFSDDSITVSGQEYQIESKFHLNPLVSNPEFWCRHYREADLPWNLKVASPVLKNALMQLKLPKQRVLVLGAGHGHDAVELARGGHVVTAVDFSPEAKQAHVSQYGEVRNLEYILCDAFDSPVSWAKQFDVIFDHTFFSAIEPQRRKQLVKMWRKWLSPGGHLLAIFFVIYMGEGPPYGVSQWELHQLLKKDFEPLYWSMSENSVQERTNQELLMYAKLRD